MKDEGARALPAQVLIETKELLNMPTIRKLGRESWHFRARSRTAEALEVILLRCFAGALDVAVASLGTSCAPRMERLGGDRITGPVAEERLIGQSLVLFLQRLGLAQRSQQIKHGVLSDVIEQFHREVFDIGHDEGAWLVLLRVGQDLLGQLEQFLSGATELASAAGVGQANGLARFGIQEEKCLGLFGRRLIGFGAALDHVAL